MAYQSCFPTGEFVLECYEPSGSFIKTQLLKEAGLHNISKLFMRSTCTNLFRELEGMPFGGSLIVEGSPGTGKSSMVFAWACWQGAKKKHIFWLHYSHSSTFYAIEFNGGKAMLLSEQESLTSILPEDGEYTIILDGMTSTTFSNRSREVGLEKWSEATRRKAIVVALMSLRICREDFGVDPSFFEMSSWTLDEYKEALQDKQFLDSVKHNLYVDDSQAVEDPDVNELVERKFFYAGHSARFFFFSTPTKLLTGDLRRLAESVNALKYISNDSIGSRQEGTVSTIQAKVNGHQVIVSGFFVRYFILKCKFKHIQLFLDLEAVKKNPAFEGWVVEWNFLLNLRVGKEFKKELKISFNEVPT